MSWRNTIHIIWQLPLDVYRAVRTEEKKPQEVAPLPKEETLSPKQEIVLPETPKKPSVKKGEK